MVDVGSYRWVVLAAAFICHALLGLVLDSSGALHVIFLEAFNGGSGDTALANSLISCTFYAVAPVTGMLVINYPCWQVALAGALLGGLGVMLSAFVCSLPMLYVTFGVLAGVGLGAAYMPTITSTGQVFDKHRSLAFGIASSGVGVGKFSGPLLISKMEEVFGWRGAMLLLGGITFNLCICALIYYRPSVAMMKVPKPCDDTDVPLPTDTNNDEPLGMSKTKESSHRSISLLNGFHKDRFGYADSNYSLAAVSEASGSADSDKKILPMENSCPGRGFLESEMIESFRKELVIEGDMTSLAAALSTSSLFLSAKETYSVEHLHSSILLRSKMSGSTMSRLIYTPRHQSAQASVQDLAVNTGVVTKTPSQISVSFPSDGTKPSIDTPDEPAKQGPACCKGFKMNFFLMRDRYFLILCFNNLLYSMGYALAQVHLPAFAIAQGQSVYYGNILVSAIGIASLVGKISLGYISQLPALSPMSVYTVTSIMAAIATAIVPLCDTFPLFLTYALFFGYISGSFGAVLPSLVVSIATVELLPSAFGFLLVFEAIGFLLGPSIGGWLYDGTGVYYSSFILGGVAMMVASTFMFYPWYKMHQPPNPPQDDLETAQCA